MTLVVTADRLHGSAVGFAVGDQIAGLLILGKPGAGKSELALELMAIGAGLVADDQTMLDRDGDKVFLRAPTTIRGLIEMRGVGILRAAPLESAWLLAIVDLDQQETSRLPERRFADVLGVRVPCLLNCASSAFPAGLKQYVMSCALQDWQDGSP